MKLILIAMLTFFAVNVMTPASYALQSSFAVAQSDDDNTSGTTSAGCVSIDAVLTPEVIGDIKGHGGSIVTLDGARSKAFMERLTELVHSQPPFSVDTIVIVQFDPEVPMVRVGFIANDCIQGSMRLPVTVLEQLLSPNETKPGERVD